MHGNRKKDDRNTPILPIGAVAKILKVHQRTLRIYDEQGILVPKRSSTNKRLYTLNDVEVGRFILFLTRNLAVNLAGVKIILTVAQKNQKLKPESYISRLKEISGLSDEELDYNAKRLSTRGRRPASAI